MVASSKNVPRTARKTGSRRPEPFLGELVIFGIFSLIATAMGGVQTTQSIPRWLRGLRPEAEKPGNPRGSQDEV